jgi:hypothetical protein
MDYLLARHVTFALSGADTALVDTHWDGVSRQDAGQG